MRNHFITASGITLLSALCFAASALAQLKPPPTGEPWGGQATGGAPGAHQKPSGSKTFDKHDLTGVWKLASNNGNSLDGTSLSVNVPPFTPWGQAKFDANKPSYGPRAVPPVQGNDPIGDCNPLGLPRIHFFGWNVEFVEASGRIVQFFQWTRVIREIWTDGRGLPDDWEPRWYGYSVGHWDGDTLVVETVGVDERSWIDHFGYPHSEDMRLEERYRRADHDTMELVITVNDPKTYTKPWVSNVKVMKLQPNAEMREELCAPADEQRFNQNVRNPAGNIKK